MVGSTLTSAVALSEPDQNQRLRDGQLKRRQSISGDNDQKRRRLSASGTAEHGPSTSNKSKNSPDKRIGTSQKPERKEEERKRGQRLFGALLGTLSQSSSSTSQKRRAEIERKQQAKLKQQDQEYTELTVKRRKELLANRRKQQILFDEQSNKIRRSNQLAMAHFLKTRSEPALFYKPWLLRPHEESKIQSQIKDAQAAIEKEAGSSNSRDRPASETETHPSPRKEVEPEATATSTAANASPDINQSSDMVGVNTNNNIKEQASQVPKHTSIPATVESNANDTAPLDSGNEHTNPHDDDTGEVVLEDKEDTVIY